MSAKTGSWNIAVDGFVYTISGVPSIIAFNATYNGGATFMEVTEIPVFNPARLMPDGFVSSVSWNPDPCSVYAELL